MKAFAFSCMYLTLYAAHLSAQDSISLMRKFSNRYITTIEQKATKVEDHLTKQSLKTVQRLKRQQDKIYKKLFKIDSNQEKHFYLIAKDNMKQH